MRWILFGVYRLVIRNFLLFIIVFLGLYFLISFDNLVICLLDVFLFYKFDICVIILLGLILIRIF